MKSQDKPKREEKKPKGGKPPAPRTQPSTAEQKARLRADVVRKFQEAFGHEDP